MNTTITPDARQYQIDRTKRILESTFFPVHKRGLVEGGYEIVDEYGRRFAKVSDRYTLVSNREIVQPIAEKFGYENVKRVERSGGKFLFEIETGRAIDIDGNGDMVKERLVVMNSYNKTKAYNFALGAFRGYCSNGMFYGMAFFNYKKIHIGEIPVQEMVGNVLNTYTQNDFELWKRMATVPLQTEEMTQALAGFNAFEVKNDKEDAVNGNRLLNINIRQNTFRYLEQNGKSFPRNVWGLYNALNSSIAHEFRWHRSQFGKVILANKNAEAYLAQRYELN